MKKILVIDDDEINNYIAEEWIRSNYSQEISMVVFADAEEAIGHLNVCPSSSFPDLIMCDLKMPAFDGFEFLEWYESTFFQKYPKTKIVILSSSIRQEDAERARSFVSVTDFVSKESVQNSFQHIISHHLMH